MVELTIYNLNIPILVPHSKPFPHTSRSRKSIYIYDELNELNETTRRVSRGNPNINMWHIIHTAKTRGSV